MKFEVGEKIRVTVYENGYYKRSGYGIVTKINEETRRVSVDSKEFGGRIRSFYEWSLSLNKVTRKPLPHY